MSVRCDFGRCRRRLRAEPDRACWVRAPLCVAEALSRADKASRARQGLAARFFLCVCRRRGSVQLQKNATKDGSHCSNGAASSMGTSTDAFFTDNSGRPSEERDGDESDGEAERQRPLIYVSEDEIDDAPAPSLAARRTPPKVAAKRRDSSPLSGMSGEGAPRQAVRDLRRDSISPASAGRGARARAVRASSSGESSSARESFISFAPVTDGGTATRFTERASSARASSSDVTLTVLGSAAPRVMFFTLRSVILYFILFVPARTLCIRLHTVYILLPTSTTETFHIFSLEQAIDAT